MNYRDPKNSKGQVERLARLYYRKFHNTLGASLSVEDLEQEFWLVWHNVCERFKPDLGFDFAAMLGVSLRNKALELSRYHYRRRGLAVSSVDAPVSGASQGATAFIDVIEDPSVEDNDTRLVRAEERQRIGRHLDPRLLKLIEMLDNPPDEIVAQVEALEAKAAYAASRGLALRAPKRVTVGMVSEVIGMSRCVRHRLVEQMQEVIAHD